MRERDSYKVMSFLKCSVPCEVKSAKVLVEIIVFEASDMLMISFITSCSVGVISLQMTIIVLTIWMSCFW